MVDGESKLIYYFHRAFGGKKKKKSFKRFLGTLSIFHHTLLWKLTSGTLLMPLSTKYSVTSTFQAKYGGPLTMDEPEWLD